MTLRSLFRPDLHFPLKPLLAGLCLLAAVGGAVAQQKRPHPGKPSAGAASAAYATDAQVVAKGQLLFQNNCSPCHSFRQKGIGPSLGRATAESSPEWLRRFIRNAPGLIAQKDERATRLFAEYKQPMPPFATLTDPDLTALLAYLHANRQTTPVARREKPADWLKDPIPTKPVQSGLRLRLEEVLTAPATDATAPLARINQLVVLPGGGAGKDRVFIEDLRGPLYELVGNELRTVMDLRQERPGFIAAPGFGTGFGSFAFHPDFYKNGLLYTTHTEKARAAPADFAYADSVRVSLQWVLTEWAVAQPTGSRFAGPGREVLRINMVGNSHGVQQIGFNPLAQPGGPDHGLLYVGVGDGGATESGHYRVCSDKTRAWGAVLRIDPRGTNGRNGRYGIPPSNPYAADPDPATCREIFCRGFRNPNRFAWTPDGRLLVTDIGQTNAEEINLAVAGADYGWPEREGTFRLTHRGDMGVVSPLPPDDARFGYAYPVAQYDHDEGKAIAGGFAYDGTALPALRGKYVFGDIVNGRLFCVETSALKPGVPAPIQELELELGERLTTFQEISGGKKPDLRLGLGANHDVYLFTKTDGKLYKVTGCVPAQ